MSVRLDKLVSERTGLARSQAQKLVRWGRVAVGGAEVRDPAAKVAEDATLVVDGDTYEAPPAILVHHKPVDVHSTMDDPWGRANLSDVVPEVWRDLFHPVGRLDADTSGLLLFSADGGFTQWMLHPRRAIEREYVATVEGAPGQALIDALAAGVATEEGTFTARVVDVDGPHVRLVVTEGKHRMVRRMLANAGHPVAALRRERFGGFRLGDLAEGEIRPATAEELAWVAESRAKKKT